MAGAGYKLFQTGDVLTAAQVNTYLNEQTVMVFANAAARTSALTSVLAEGMMSYLQDTNSVEVYNGSSWVNVGNAGDITEVQAGVGISIASGTGPIPVITNSSTDLITTAGDLLYGTAADTVARLGIGTAGQVLKVNSGATAPEWGAAGGASGLTLVTKSSFSAVTSHSINNCFSATYDFYEVKIAFTASSGAPDFTIRLRASGTDDSADYAGTTIYAFGATLGSNANNALGTDEFFVGGSGSTTANYTGINAQICNPFKSQVTTLFADSSYGTSNVFNFQNIGYHNDAGSFDGFTLLSSTGTMTGTIYVYGLAV